MHIRKYEESDYPTINALYYTCRPDEFKNESLCVDSIRLNDNPSDLKKFEASDVYVCEIRTVIVGFVTVHDNSIGWLYVDPKFRCRGIGGKLLSFLKLETEGGLILFTLKSNNTAVDLYIKHGFLIVDEFKDPAFDEEIWICKLKFGG